VHAIRMTMAIVSVVRKSDIQWVSKFPLTITSQNQFALSNIHQLDIADGLKELLLNKTMISVRTIFTLCQTWNRWVRC